VAVVDSGVNASIPLLLEALRTLGHTPQDVDYLILTHVHLDHAGGAGLAMRHLPNARLVVHPRGARHMAEPSRLVAGTIAVYGEEATRTLYDDIVPVDAARIVAAEDGFRIGFGGRELRVLDTPGHARHHICLWDEASRALFTGDSFGISYRELDGDGRAFIIPATTPVQFDPDAALATLDRLLALDPERAYLAHFSEVTQLKTLAGELATLLDAHVAIARAAARQGDGRHARIKKGLEELFVEHFGHHGCRAGRARILETLAHDIELNAQGLGVWLDTAAETSPRTAATRS
jgi:hydroxyacylglutathione hydrolase